MQTQLTDSAGNPVVNAGEEPRKRIGLAGIGNTLTVAGIARVCHETNRAYCYATGDESQPHWDAAPDWQCESAMNGVMFHVANPDAKPEDSHNNWLEQKLAEGWKYGPVKDPVKKEHPCIVPYNGLPVAQQVKDALFIAVVRTLKGLLPKEEEKPQQAEKESPQETSQPSSDPGDSKGASDASTIPGANAPIVPDNPGQGNSETAQ